MDKYFENVCELDIMYNIEKAHYILDEMIMNGQIVETNKTLILAPLYVLDKVQEWFYSMGFIRGNPSLIIFCILLYFIPASLNFLSTSFPKLIQFSSNQNHQSSNHRIINQLNL